MQDGEKIFKDTTALQADFHGGRLASVVQYLGPVDVHLFPDLDQFCSDRASVSARSLDFDRLPALGHFLDGGETRTWYINIECTINI